MGFSSNLLSKAAHEALLNRQDAELRLLETMRRCLINKAKCDKENALALLSVAAQGQKIERSEDLSGSLLAHAWKTMMVELENTAKLIRQNAETIESKSLEKLNFIFIDKRKARKQYQEDHNRLTAQFTRLTEDVARKKMEYQKNLESYKLSRSRFEEHYIKSGRVGRKLDEVREKYQKACRKLHLTHNEYVLLLNEAAEYERDYRTVLLPGLLEHQQAVQESCIAAWKILLQDISQNSNLGSEKFLQVHRRVDAGIDAVKPIEEYFDFTEKFKSSPLPPTEFTFDDSLVDDTSGKLQANQLMVDNLTIDWIRWKLADLEAALKDSPEKSVPSGADAPSSHRKSSGDTLPRPVSGDISRKGANELLCQERKVQRQIEVIKTALSELGCEEIPSGCDLSLDPFESITDGQQGDRVSVKTLHTQQRIVNILRKPFRRKSVPPSPCLARGDFSSLAVGEENTCKAVVTDTKASSGCRPLVDEEWFHGVLPREEVVRLLTHEGDFLVRETTRNAESQIVLSVCWGGHKHFIVQTTAEGQFRFEGLAFPTIPELIQHQWESGLLVTSRSGAILKKPIFRECWELNNDDVELLDKIGRGNFGDVYKARLKPSNIDVAVKTCRLTLPDEHKKKFLQEGRILKQYDHPNIVKLIGICVQKQPIMIVMELVPGGSLVTYLRNRASVLETKQLMGMCRDAAAGMSYLESKNCIHRDLAARNCLVSHDNTVKISDFGMSREEEEYIVSDGMKQIPIKWTAPEALNFGKYTTLCDVWSYGILAWEIFAKGGIPYSNMSNTKARERIDDGYRMPPPEGIPNEMYQLLLRCWEYEPEKRPHFHEIFMVVETLHAAMR